MNYIITYIIEIKSSQNLNIENVKTFYVQQNINYSFYLKSKKQIKLIHDFIYNKNII